MQLQLSNVGKQSNGPELPPNRQQDGDQEDESWRRSRLPKPIVLWALSIEEFGQNTAGLPP